MANFINDPLEDRRFNLSFYGEDSESNPWSVEDMDFESMDEADAVQNLEVGQSCTFGHVTTTRIS
jgi:hypothetical protein